MKTLKCALKIWRKLIYCNLHVKYKEFRVQHSAYGDAFLHLSFLHSHINQYGCLFTSSPQITLSLLKSIRGGNLHVLTLHNEEAAFLSSFLTG